MGSILVLAAVVFFVLGGVYLVLTVLRSAQQPALPTRSPAYRNHLGMARWIERSLNDDMVRVTISSADQRAAQRLLEEFYGEEREIGPGE